MSKIIIETSINAPAEKVWSVLIDFASYPRWNPYQTIRGEAKLYGIVDLESRGADGRKFQSFRAAIFRLEPVSRLEFLTGKLFWNASRRIFWLDPTVAGTRLTHGLIFSGLAAGMLAPKATELAHLRPLYESFGAALKRTAEQDLTPRGSRKDRLEAKRRGQS